MITILQGDWVDKLRTLPDESVHCCVTSPPYWGLRDYGTAQWEGGSPECNHMVDRFATRVSKKQASNAASGSKQARDVCPKCGAVRIDRQLGLEATPEEYVGKLVEGFREVWRVLRNDGTVWLNLGDSYGGSCGNTRGEAAGGGKERGIEIFGETIGFNKGGRAKDLCGIPWRVAFALQADGWWLRQDIIWHKPNPMPESVTDRCTKAHEYIFLLTKSERYFYDAEAIKEQGVISAGTLAAKGSEKRFNTPGVNSRPPEYKEYDGTRNKRSVWSAAEDEWWQFLEWKRLRARDKRDVWPVKTASYSEAHFATFPPDFIKPCILAGTSARGCCPTCGAPWERTVNKESHQEQATWSGAGRGNGCPAGGGHEGRTGQWSATTRTVDWRPTCECYLQKQATTDLCRSVPATVLDPFGGSGTTGAVALELGRKAVLIELNPKYVKLIEQRTFITPGLALA